MACGVTTEHEPKQALVAATRYPYPRRSVIDLFIRLEFGKTKGEIRRLVAAGGARLNDIKLDDAALVLVRHSMDSAPLTMQNLNLVNSSLSLPHSCAIICIRTPESLAHSDPSCRIKPIQLSRAASNRCHVSKRRRFPSLAAHPHKSLPRASCSPVNRTDTLWHKFTPKLYQFNLNIIQPSSSLARSHA